MVGRVERTCQVCGSNVGFTMSDDGFFYCGYCNSQADDIIDTGVDEEQLFTHYSASCNRTTRPAKAKVVAPEPRSQVKLTTSQYLDHPDVSMDDVEDVGDGVGPTGPSDFGSSSKKNFSYEGYYTEIRSRYLTGIQIMIQLQCKALVEEFNVSPLIIGLIGPVWLRFLASTSIMGDEWADRAVHDSEAQTQGEAEDFQPSAQYSEEPVNIHGKRVVYVWYRSLRSTIPISCTLAISFLVCHVAREAITPSDMLKWTLEGKLPYFAAYVEIEKQIGSSSEACPIRVSRMFRPIQVISSQKLESMAADIAQKIGLELPPVNFYAIASRYLRQLSLPIVEILPLACRVCEWSSPPDLYLSANELRIPTRACVMSILIVTIRILFDINGYGMWESSLSNPSCSLSPVRNEDTESRSCLNTRMNDDDDDSSSNNLEPSGTKSDVLDSSLNVINLLQILEAKYDKLDDVVYSCDLPSYLQYCKDVAFSGLQPSYEDLEEEKLLKELWDFYLNNKDTGTLDNREDVGPSNQEEVKKTNRDENTLNSTSQKTDTCLDGDQDSDSAYGSQPSKDESIRRLKLDMDNNKFCYIAPRVKVTRKDYLHYARRRKDVFVYAVHADYYILLRSCAKVAEVETRVMHIEVLRLEKRLRWLEKRVDSLLHLELNFNDDCDFCKDVDEPEQNIGDDPMHLNN